MEERAIVGPEDAGCRVTDYIFQRFPSSFPSRSQAKRAGTLGLVRVNDDVTRSGAIHVQAGDVVSVDPPPPRDAAASATAAPRHDGEIRVLYESEAHLVVWKPAGTKLRGRPAPLPAANGRRCAPCPEGGGLEGEMCRRLGRWCAVVPGAVLPKAACGLVLLAVTPAALPTLGGDTDGDADGDAGGDGDGDGGDDADADGGGDADTDGPDLAGVDVEEDIEEDVDVDDEEDGYQCADCDTGCCLVTLVIVCGAAPSRATLPLGGSPPRSCHYRRRHRTPSNRHGHLSTLELHAAHVPHQRALQDALRHAGLPLGNDPAAGRAARVPRCKHLLMARVGLSVAHGVAHGAARFRLREAEPPAFAAVRRSERDFHARRRRQEEEEGDAVPFGGIVVHAPPGEAMRPRRSTETLVDAARACALRLARDASAAHPRQIRILDLGTGSGNILLALLAALWRCPDIRACGVGVDASDAALAVAAGNARRIVAEHGALRAGEGVVLRRGTFESPLDPGAAEVCRLGDGGDAREFDLLVSNPPYLAERWAALDSSARTRDPEMALFAGEDGTAAYRQMARSVPALLAAHGAFFLEMAGGDRKGSEAIQAMFKGEAVVHRDYKGMERVLEFDSLAINE